MDVFANKIKWPINNPGKWGMGMGMGFNITLSSIPLLLSNDPPQWKLFHSSYILWFTLNDTLGDKKYWLINKSFPSSKAFGLGREMSFSFHPNYHNFAHLLIVKNNFDTSILFLKTRDWDVHIYVSFIAWMRHQIDISQEPSLWPTFIRPSVRPYVFLTIRLFARPVLRPS